MMSLHLYIFSTFTFLIILVRVSLFIYIIKSISDCPFSNLQTVNYILQECQLVPHCSDHDLKQANPTAV